MILISTRIGNSGRGLLGFDAV